MKTTSRTMLTRVALTAGAFLGAIALSAAAQTSGWSNPTAAPTGNNVAAPLNVGSLLQQRSGPLQLNNNFGLVGTFIYASGTPQVGQVLTAVDSLGTVAWKPAASVSPNTLMFVGYYTSPEMNLVVPAGATKLIITPTADMSCELPADKGSTVSLEFYVDGAKYASLVSAAGNNNGAQTRLAASTNGVINVTQGTTINLTVKKNTYNSTQALYQSSTWSGTPKCPNGSNMVALFNGYSIFSVGGSGLGGGGAPSGGGTASSTATKIRFCRRSTATCPANWTAIGGYGDTNDVNKVGYNENCADGTFADRLPSSSFPYNMLCAQ